MSVSLVSRNVARKLLLVQLLVVIASGLLFSLKDPFWGVSAISGGLAVFLPNVLFMIFAWRHLIVTWVLVLVVQILAPAVINNKG